MYAKKLEFPTNFNLFPRQVFFKKESLPMANPTTLNHKKLNRVADLRGGGDVVVYVKSALRWRLQPARLQPQDGPSAADRLEALRARVRLRSSVGD